MQDGIPDPVRRAVMVTISPLLADVIRRVVAGHVAIEIVAEIRKRSRLEARLRTLRPEIVLMGLHGGEDDKIARVILAALPKARIIAFSSDVRVAYVHEARPHRTELRDFSTEALFAILSLPSWLADLS